MSKCVVPKVCYEAEARLLERRRLRNRVARVFARIIKEDCAGDKVRDGYIKRQVMEVFKT